MKVRTYLNGFLVILSVVLVEAAALAEVPELGSYDARFIENFEGRKTAHLETGSWENCDVSHHGSLTTYECDVVSGRFRLSDQGANALVMPLESVAVMTGSVRGKTYHTFRFSGVFPETGRDIPQESVVAVTVQYYEHEPADRKGTWTLPDFDINRAFIPASSQ